MISDFNLGSFEKIMAAKAGDPLPCPQWSGHRFQQEQFYRHLGEEDSDVEGINRAVETV